MVILTILILSIYEHSMSFHLFVLSFIYFLSVSYSLPVQVFTSLGRFIPKYFILFDATVNEIASLISLSYGSLLVYRNAADLYI